MSGAPGFEMFQSVKVQAFSRAVDGPFDHGFSHCGTSLFVTHCEFPQWLKPVCSAHNGAAKPRPFPKNLWDLMNNHSYAWTLKVAL